MVIDSKKSAPKVPPIVTAQAAAPSTTVFRDGRPTTATPAGHLKASTITKLKPEPNPDHDPKFQAMMAGITAENSDKSVAGISYERYRRFELLTQNSGEISGSTPNGEELDSNDPIDTAHAEFRKNNPHDREVTADFEERELNPHYTLPTIMGTPTRPSTDNRTVVNDGFTPPAQKLDKTAARTQLAGDIRQVSALYASEAGMTEVDFAKVLGGIAVIESRFGVARSIPAGATRYPSSAGGAFHYLDGTIAAEVRQSMSDPRIAARVAQLGVSLKDGVSKSEAWAMKDDNLLAGSITAKNIVEAVRRRPDLKKDVVALTTYVYQSHNLGEAGANALARGGRAELERVSHMADDNNPMFFKGATSDAEIQNRYTQFVKGAIGSATPLIETAFSSAPPTTFAASAPDRKPQPA